MAKKLRRDDQAAEIVLQAFRLGGLLPDARAAEVSALFPNSDLFEYAPDEHIIEQDETGKDVFVLCAGKVAIAKTLGTAGTTLATLEPGAIFGEMALLRDGVRVATVAAQAKCKIFRLAARDIEAVLRSHPHVGTLLLELAAKRSV